MNHHNFVRQFSILPVVVLVYLVFLIFGSIGVCGVSSSEISQLPSSSFGGIIIRVNRPLDPPQPPARRRSLLSLPDEHETVLHAALDGTINLVDKKSNTIIWSFASGPSIYSSYQASVTHDNDKENGSGPGGSYFVDCGDDWKLFAHTEHGKVNLDMSVDEFLRITPHIAEDGGVVLGSKRTTVFLVDGKTGSLIYTYRLSDTPPALPSNEKSGFLLNESIEEWEESGFVNLKPDVLPLYITRTDYLLKSFAANSGKVLWNVTVADIGAAFLCQDFENSLSGTPTLGNELPAEPGVHFNMPLSCQSKVVVLRSGSPHMVDSLSVPGRLLEDRHEDLISPANELLSALTTTKNLVLFLIGFLLIVVGLSIHCCSAVAGKPTKQHGGLNAKAVSSKRKKPRKSGKSSSLIEKKGKTPSSDDDGDAWTDSERKSILNFTQRIDGDADGRNIGKLFVSGKEIAKGSNGTVVLEGIYEGRQVAVKRLVRAHHDVAFKEIQNLIASDRHPNIVRWYGVEYDQDFVYLSLERCNCSLNDLIQMHSDLFEKSAHIQSQATKAVTEYKVRWDSVKGMQDIELWRANGYPSPILLKLMRDVVSGLVHLHELGIIHRDLKPQNVLIINERSLSAKLSDMGISKRLLGDMSSLGHHATGYGSSGWQAPEQLLLGRQTRAVDLFSLGCVLFYCITRGRHPFGDHLERDINVAKNKVDLFLVENIPEAVDLLSHLLHPRAELRLKALQVLHHPLFWTVEMRLSFLRDTSDRVELEDREGDSDILRALESVAPVALGGKWNEKMESVFIANIGRYRRYKYDSVRDLLRVMRNKLNHYRELPKEIQELLGSVPEGFDDYFASRFRKLLIEVYKVMYKFCKEEEWLQKYLGTNLV